MKDKSLCEFPLCKRIVVREGFCVSHAPYFAPPKTKQPPKKIAYRSEKRKKDQKVYNKIVTDMILENPECSIHSPVCEGKAQGANHLQKRSPSNLLVRKNLETACNACNSYCEQFPEWAKENGHSISRFKKVI